MEGTYESKPTSRVSPIVKALGAVVLAGAGFAGGMFYAHRSSPFSELERIAKHPVAAEALDVSPIPGQGPYSVAWRLNKQNERETYLQDHVRNIEWRLPMTTPDYLTADLGNGRYAMIGAAKMVQGVRKVYGIVGTPEEPQPIVQMK